MNNLPLTTVIGAQGFVGRNLVRYLEELQLPYYAPARTASLEEMCSQHLGHVIYAAGVTSDFRQRPYDTMRAHVTMPGNLLEQASFDSFLYLSSTRIYLDLPVGEEEIDFMVNPRVPEHLFHLSKLAGESLCLQSGRTGVRIARLSNVCGDDFDSGNFLYEIIKEAARSGTITLRTGLNSAKDYIGIEDVVKLLLQIAHGGQSDIYNIASGVNTTHKQATAWIREVTGCEVKAAEAVDSVMFPTIDIKKIQHEFGFITPDIRDMIQKLAIQFKQGKYDQHNRKETEWS